MCWVNVCAKEIEGETVNTTSQNARLKQAADDYFWLAKSEAGGMYYGALMGMRSVCTIIEHKAMERYVDLLLEQLKREKHVD